MAGQKKLQIIEDKFTHHPPPDVATIEKYKKLRDAHKDLAYMIMEMVPVGEEQVVAIRHLESCMMFSNAGIARCGD